MCNDVESVAPTSLEELRRRVYSADATDEDRARYRAALENPAPAEGEPSSPEPEPVPEPARPVRTRRRVRYLLGAVAAVTVIVAVLEMRAQSSPIPHSSASPVNTLHFDDPVRAEFLRNLAGGRMAGITAYLHHRSAPALAGTTRSFVVERHGIGPQLMVLGSVPAAARQGRATVFLVTDRPDAVDWTAYRTVVATNGLATIEPEAGRGAVVEGGELTSATFAYRAGRQPVEVRIEVPQGVRWGAAVLFTD